jgi:hypothetical protein
MLSSIGPFTGAILSYLFVKNLSTPFVDTDAYKLGIIDANGNTLIPLKNLKNPKQKKAYTRFHRLCWNIRKILLKIPFIKSRLGSFITAFYLLKEEVESHGQDFQPIEKEMINHLKLDMHTLLVESYVPRHEIPKINDAVRLKYGVYDEHGNYYYAGIKGYLKETSTIFGKTLSVCRINVAPNKYLWVTYDAIRKD